MNEDARERLVGLREKLRLKEAELEALLVGRQIPDWISRFREVRRLRDLVQAAEWDVQADW